MGVGCFSVLVLNRRALLYYMKYSSFFFQLGDSSSSRYSSVVVYYAVILVCVESYKPDSYKTHSYCPCFFDMSSVRMPGTPAGE